MDAIKADTLDSNAENLLEVLKILCSVDLTV